MTMDRRVKRPAVVGDNLPREYVFRQLPEGENIEDYAAEDLFGGRRGGDYEVLPDDAVIVPAVESTRF